MFRDDRVRWADEQLHLEGRLAVDKDRKDVVDRLFRQLPSKRGIRDVRPAQRLEVRADLHLVTDDEALFVDAMVPDRNSNARAALPLARDYIACL